MKNQTGVRTILRAPAQEAVEESKWRSPRWDTTLPRSLADIKVDGINLEGDPVLLP